MSSAAPSIGIIPIITSTTIQGRTMNIINIKGAAIGFMLMVI